MNAIASNQTPFDRELGKVEASLRSTITKISTPERRSALLNQIMRFTPRLVQQIHETHSQIHSYVADQDDEVALNMAAMEEEDAPLLLNWSKLCEDLQNLQNQTELHGLNEKHKAAWLTVLQKTSRLLKLVRAREESLAACYMSVCQREHAIG